MRFIPLLFAPLHSLCGYIFVFWACTRKPHRSALEHFGIRIVSSKEYTEANGVDDQGEVHTALSLLEQFDPERMREIKRCIRTMFLCSIGVEAGYFAAAKVCLLNLHKDERASIGMSPTEIAGVLAYFASLAQFGGRLATIPEQKREEVEGLCRKEQQHVVEKLRAARDSTN